METYSWVDDNDKDHSLSVRGPRLLVRKCLRNDEDFLVGEATEEISADARLMIEGMMRSERLVPEAGARGTNWCSVLAIGEGVNCSRSPVGMRKYKRGENYAVPWGVVAPIDIDDLVVLPETSGYGDMWRGVTGSKYDLLVDVSELISWLPHGCNILPIPIGQRVLVEPDKDDQMVGDIEIPDIGVERPTTGTVIKTGTGTLGKNGNPIPFTVEVGQIVMFPRDKGIDSKFNGKSYNILNETDISAILG